MWGAGWWAPQKQKRVKHHTTPPSLTVAVGDGARTRTDQHVPDEPAFDSLAGVRLLSAVSWDHAEGFELGYLVAD